jgi:non-ribosomal peptide synthetase component F
VPEKHMKNDFSNNGIDFPLLASNAFDISLFESFLPLLSGGTAFMLRNEQVKDISCLAEQLKSVNAFHAVPALMAQVIKHIRETGTQDQYSGIKELFIGGDSVPSIVLEEMRKVFPAAHIQTLYGPTESTIFITTNQYLNKETDVFRGSVIGKPNQDIRYIF